MIRVLPALALCVLILVLDQVSKWIVIEHIIKSEIGVPGSGLSAFLLTVPQAPLDFVQMRVTSFFNLVIVWNTGVNYFMPGDIRLAPLVMAALSGLLALGLAIWMCRALEPRVRFALAAIVGGAVSNIWDRLRFGGVADFLDFHAFGWHWPAFNVADAAIVLGVAVLLAHELFWVAGPKRQPSSQE